MDGTGCTAGHMTTSNGSTPARGRGSAGAAGRDGARRGYASGKDDYLVRLRKIEGQVRGLQQMIESDRWCPEVVVQVASATRALQEVAVGLLDDHLRHCVLSAAGESPEAGAAQLDEVTATIRQVVRL
ncbi:MAG: metal-sensitive transcriptional regulator [Actinomycetota bacterium]|nr:metal-sensitive transcriptional regulator [Actinomycetota bacterium]